MPSEIRKLAHSSSPPPITPQSESYAQEAAEKIPYYTGEHRQLMLKDSYVFHTSGLTTQVIMVMTEYRLIFIPCANENENQDTFQVPAAFLQIPLACIDKLEKEKKQLTSIKHHNITINIVCKDARQYRVSMLCKPSTVISSPKDLISTTEADIERAFNVMYTWTFPNDVQHLFAITYGASARHLFPTSEPYTIDKEISRLGILDTESTNWRISAVNAFYEVCDSYPKTLVVPKVMTDDDLKTVAQFRSGGRLPVLCWGDKLTGATIWRSSQPKGGINGSCFLDEAYLDIIAKSSFYHVVPPSFFEFLKEPKEKAINELRNTPKPATGIQGFLQGGLGRNSISLDKIASAAGIPHDAARKHWTDDDMEVLMIIDCRPRANALVNRAAGAGYEASSNYPSARLDFYNIGNIHVMRDSFRSLRTVLSSYEYDTNFSKHVENTEWLHHLRMVLKAGYSCYHLFPFLFHSLICVFVASFL